MQSANQESTNQGAVGSRRSQSFASAGRRSCKPKANLKGGKFASRSGRKQRKRKSVAETSVKSSEFPEDLKEREALAEQIADEVRKLRLEREAVPDGAGRRARRKGIGLKIDVLRWKMHLLNPRRYKAVK
jgi:hypothetical protein